MQNISKLLGTFASLTVEQVFALITLAALIVSGLSVYLALVAVSDVRRRK